MRADLMNSPFEVQEAAERLLLELFGEQVPVGAIVEVDGNFTSMPTDVLRRKLTAFILRDYKRSRDNQRIRP